MTGLIMWLAEWRTRRNSRDDDLVERYVRALPDRNADELRVAVGIGTSRLFAALDRLEDLGRVFGHRFSGRTLRQYRAVP